MENIIKSEINKTNKVDDENEELDDEDQENDDEYDKDQLNNQNSEPVEKNYSSCRTNKDIKQYEIWKVEWRNNPKNIKLVVIVQTNYLNMHKNASYLVCPLVPQDVFHYWKLRLRMYLRGAGSFEIVRQISVQLRHNYFKMKTSTQSRFDTRLSKEQKEFFEYAAQLGGFRTLTEFVIHSTQKHAAQIVEKHQSILQSKKDQAVLFDALMNPPKPNTNLKKAVARYNKATTKK